MKRLAITAFALIVTLAPSGTHADEGPPERGFLLEFSFGGTVPANPFGTALPSLVVGYRFADRLQLQVGFLFSAVSGCGSGCAAGEGFFVVPQLSLDLARFEGKKVTLYGIAGTPLGAAFGEGSGPGGSGSGAVFVAGFQVGVGVRYAFKRAFSLGFESGLLALFDVGGNSAGGTGTAAGVTFYAAFTGTIYFGQ